MADVIDFNFDPGPIFGFFMFFALFAFAFMIWMLVDAITRPEAEFPTPGSKTAWTVGLAVGLFFTPFGFIAALVYLFVVRIPARNRRAAPAWSAAPGAPAGAPPVPSHAPPHELQELRREARRRREVLPFVRSFGSLARPSS